MKDDTSIIRFRQPEAVEDPLTEIAREGARRMLATALEAEIGVFRRPVRRRAAAGRPAARGSAWVRSGAGDPDRDRAARRSGGRRSGTARRTDAARRSGSRRISCRDGRAAR